MSFPKYAIRIEQGAIVIEKWAHQKKIAEKKFEGKNFLKGKNIFEGKKYF